MRAIDLRTGEVLGSPFEEPGFSEHWYAKATPEGWLYLGSSDLVLLSHNEVLHAFGPASRAEVTNGRVLVQHLSKVAVFDLASRATLFATTVPTRCLPILLHDSLVIIEEDRRTDFTLDGTVVSRAPNARGSRVFSTTRGQVECIHFDSDQGPSSSLSGAVSAQLSGMVNKLETGPHGFIATIAAADHNVVLYVNSRAHHASLPSNVEVRLFAEEDAFLAVGGGEAVCWSAGRVRRYAAPASESMSGILYQGKPIFLLRQQLVMHGESRFPPSTRDLGAKIQREEWATYAVPDEPNGFASTILYGPEPAEDRLTLHMAKVAFGWAMTGWTSGTETHTVPPIQLQEDHLSPEVDRINVVDTWLRTRIADPGWTTLMRQAQTEEGRSALGRMGLKLGGYVDDPFVHDAALISFAHDGAQTLYLAYYEGTLGVAGFDTIEKRMHWRAKSLADFMLGKAPVSTPAWFRWTYLDPALDRIVVQLLDDAEHYARARLATPPSGSDWVVPIVPFNLRVLEVLSGLAGRPGLGRTRNVLQRLISDLSYREAILRAGLEVNTNQTRWSHPQIMVFANTHAFVWGPDKEVGVFEIATKTWRGAAEAFFHGLPESLRHRPRAPEWYSELCSRLDE